MEETRTTHPPADRAAATPIEGNERTITNTVQFDLEAYMPLLEDTDIPDDQKLDLLRALHAIMASFVDLGFSIENPPCGKPQELADPSAQAVRDHVYSSHHNFIERFENAAGPVRDAAQEGVEA
ncbi:hypothetical protein [Henriciella mobilis]|uniref:Uncharacterized protein n=1 Tax=Henriciella mobilis TaxID=2305467 RepID=A0A399RD89_9PROT|nr:hypothetical protein [Henriciella mobilis]RIJ28431.1 hypothetical protein D1223_13685 [Henriciella mobilis]